MNRSFGRLLTLGGIAFAAALTLAVAAPPASAGTARMPRVPPAEAGMDAGCLAEIEPLVSDAIARGDMPGCVIAVGHRGKVVYERAFGLRQVEPEPVPMTLDTVFDLASLTKPVATATCVMLLAEQDKVDLDAPVAGYLPEFTGNGKERITVRHLLTHQSGLLPDNALADYEEGAEEAWRRITALKLRSEPGEKFAYSDVGFIVLGELVRRVAGEPLDRFARANVFLPLGMEATYLPEEPLRLRAAPTEQRDGHWMRGEVHDPRSFLLGGVAGHAGLFATADDLTRYAQMLLGRGQYDGVRVLTEETVDRMAAAEPVSSGLRGLGWDIRTGYSSNRGEGFSERAFGHGGFTGTVLWIDPGLDLFVVFLSNRQHPDGEGAVNALAGKIGTVAARALTDSTTAAAQEKAEVLTGIDVLVRDHFRQLAGRRVGLITNQTGIDRAGRSTARLLHEAGNLELVALFSPEHGIQGRLDVGNIADARDEATALPVFSLYGATRRPTPEMLSGIDTLVFDIQDIGTRFYTYISTMGLAMQSAAEQNLRFVVLDRPNPIGGRAVAGPVLDAGRESFVGFHRIPVRHGMTVGELALLFREELGLKLDLQVIALEGWSRDRLFDATGLPWVNPSPNMRSLNAAILYPGIGLLETTNLSVGRGTETPFELLGAPWIEGEKLAAALNARGLPGIAFDALAFTPDASVFAGKACQGVRIRITDRAALDPVRAGFAVAVTLRGLYPEAWEAKGYDRLLACRAVHEALLAGKDVPELEALYQADLDAFLTRRARILLYPGP